MSVNSPTEDHLYEFMHEHGQCMEDIEAHLGVLHNLFMEVNDCLNDLDTGRCRCKDVPLSPVLDEPQVSPSISAVGGGEEVVLLMMTVDEDEVPLPLQVLSGNWTCHTYVFLCELSFPMFLSQFPLCFPY